MRIVWQIGRKVLFLVTCHLMGKFERLYAKRKNKRQSILKNY